MYSVEEIRDLVGLLRDVFSELSINNVIEDFERAVEIFGVDVKYSFMGDETDNVSGYLMYSEGKPTIVLNATETPARQRFTLAHELGHLLLHWNWLPDSEENDLQDGRIYEISYRNKPYYTPEELVNEEDADTFAGEFLLPIEEIVSLSRDIKKSDALVNAIAKKYKVSKACASVRIFKLRNEGKI